MSIPLGAQAKVSREASVQIAVCVIRNITRLKKKKKKKGLSDLKGFRMLEFPVRPAGAVIDLTQ